MECVMTESTYNLEITLHRKKFLLWTIENTLRYNKFGYVKGYIPSSCFLPGRMTGNVKKGR